MGRSKEDGIILTGKQRDVLELLLMHMTSKEIARHLEISPHTVEQRIGIAKKKLGALSRSDLVARYIQVCRGSTSGCEKAVYDFSYLPPSRLSLSQDSSSDAESSGDQTSPSSSHTSEIGKEIRDSCVVPEAFDGRYGTLVRLGAILGLAALMLIVLLGGLAMFGELSQILGQ